MNTRRMVRDGPSQICSHPNNRREDFPDLIEPIVFYCTEWCPDCTRSRRQLRRLNVPFEEIDVESVAGAEDRMKAFNGGSGKVPTIVIGNRVLIEPTDREICEAV